MAGVGSFASAFEQHARRRAGGQPTPSVLVGDVAVREWESAQGTRGVVHLTATSPDAAAMDYLDDAFVRRVLATRVTGRVDAARGARSIATERTSFERALWCDVARDALLSVGDEDAHLLVGYLFEGAEPTPLRAFAAGTRILGGRAPAALVALSPDQLDAALRVAIALAEASPMLPVGVATVAEAWSSWLAMPGREHAKAIVRSCVIEGASTPAFAVGTPVAEAIRSGAETTRPRTAEDDEAARSAAERALFEALEAHAASRGRFALNHVLSIPFGGRPLEIDLACVALRLAVEVDGYFHFRDPEAYRRDRRKDVVLQRHGYFVVRVLAEDVMTGLDETVALVHEAMSFLSERTSEERRG